MSYFYFNGFYSYEMGLIVEDKNIYNGTQPDFGLISVPGRDGGVILDHNRFKNVEVSYTVSFIGTKQKTKNPRTDPRIPPLCLVCNPSRQQQNRCRDKKTPF